MTSLSILYLDEDRDIHVEIDVTIDYYQPEIIGKHYGDWEDSYPDEPAEVEYTVCTAGYKDLEYALDFQDLVLDKLQEVCEDD